LGTRPKLPFLGLIAINIHKAAGSDRPAPAQRSPATNPQPAVRKGKSAPAAQPDSEQTGLREALGKIPQVRSDVVSAAQAEVEDGTLLTRDSSLQTVEAYLRSEKLEPNGSR
tara:strand:- start:143 stop:478 length:336 start_codon:yes stop_codon:yes gene_type:complete